MLLDLIGLRHRVNDLARHGTGAFQRRFAEQHDKLVAAQAGYRIHTSPAGDQAMRHLGQQLVASEMPERIVDRLEMIEIDKHQGDLLALAFGSDQRLFDPILQQGAVGQAGQWIIICQLADTLLRGVPLGDIGFNANVIKHFSGSAMINADRQPDRVHLAVLAPVPDLALPVIFPLDIPPHAGKKLSGLTPGAQDAGIFPDHFHGSESGHRRKGRVDRHDPASRIGDDDRFLAALEDARCQLQFGFDALALADIAKDALNQAAAARRLDHVAARLDHDGVAIGRQDHHFIRAAATGPHMPHEIIVVALRQRRRQHIQMIQANQLLARTQEKQLGLDVGIDDQTGLDISHQNRILRTFKECGIAVAGIFQRLLGLALPAQIEHRTDRCRASGQQTWLTKDHDRQVRSIFAQAGQFIRRTGLASGTLPHFLDQQITLFRHDQIKRPELVHNFILAISKHAEQRRIDVAELVVLQNKHADLGSVHCGAVLFFAFA